jgi:hypothetical protein
MSCSCLLDSRRRAKGHLVRWAYSTNDLPRHISQESHDCSRCPIHAQSRGACVCEAALLYARPRTGRSSSFRRLPAYSIRLQAIKVRKQIDSAPPLRRPQQSLSQPMKAGRSDAFWSPCSCYRSWQRASQRQTSIWPLSCLDECSSPPSRSAAIRPSSYPAPVGASATPTSALIPWNSSSAYMAATLSAATFSYAPYAIFNDVSPLLAIGVAIAGARALRHRHKRNEAV